MFGSKGEAGDGLNEVHFVGMPPEVEAMLRKRIAEAMGDDDVRFVSRYEREAVESRSKAYDELRGISAKAAIVSMAREMWSTLVLRDLAEQADVLGDLVDEDVVPEELELELDEDRVTQYAKATMKACAIFLREADALEVKIVDGGEA